MATVFIGLGSNLGDGRDNLQRAWQRLGAVRGVRLIRISSPYRTEPLDMESLHWFTNAVGMLETSLPPAHLLKEMLAIEQEMGRVRAKGRDRTVDLDLLYYDDAVFDSPDLTLPHPQIQNRLFVLVPMEELAPDFIHPALRITTGAMRQKLLSSVRIVEKISWPGKGNMA